MDIKKLKQCVAQGLKCDVNSIELSSGLGSHIKWDSLAHVAVLTSIENEFEVEFSDSEVEELRTVSDFLKYFGLG